MVTKLRAHFQTVSGKVPGQVLHIEKEIEGLVPFPYMKVNTGTVEGTIDNVQFNNGEYIATLMELIHADDIDTGKAWKQLQKDGWSSLEPIEKK